jgi:tetratricopeptide (TPR) repeat protein
LAGALAGLFAVSLLVGIAAWRVGTTAGRDQLIREQSKQTPELSSGAGTKIDQAMAELFSGDVGAAKGTLQELQSLDPDIAPLSYLLALAAFRSGDLQGAESQARESIAKRERISDSLAMLSLIESHRAGDPKAERFGDPLLRGEFLLRQAVRADAANPLPLIELSANLREQNRLPEAIRLLESAASRVQPVDTPTFVAATLALARLQNLTDADLPEISNPDKDLPAGFSAAYVALRKGDTEGARKILIRLRRTTDPRLFRYIIHDQAFRWYASEIKAGDQPATD